MAYLRRDLSKVVFRTYDPECVYKDTPVMIENRLVGLSHVLQTHLGDVGAKMQECLDLASMGIETPIEDIVAFISRVTWDSDRFTLVLDKNLVGLYIFGSYFFEKHRICMTNYTYHILNALITVDRSRIVITESEVVPASLFAFLRTLPRGTIMELCKTPLGEVEVWPCRGNCIVDGESTMEAFANWYGLESTPKWTHDRSWHPTWLKYFNPETIPTEDTFYNIKMRYIANGFLMYEGVKYKVVKYVALDDLYTPNWNTPVRCLRKGDICNPGYFELVFAEPGRELPLFCPCLVLKPHSDPHSEE